MPAISALAPTRVAGVLLLVGASVALSVGGAFGKGAAPPPPTTETTSSLSVTAISVPEGTVRVRLPDDMAAGDTISGTVVEEPAGSTDAERNKNAATLDGYVVELGAKKADVAGRVITFVVPAAATSATLILRHRNGTLAGRVDVPVRTQQNPFTRPPVPSDFHFPQAVAAGQPFPVSGPFGGNAANTTLGIGGRPAELIAESPRKLVAAPPLNVSGPTSMQLKEGGVTAAAPVNVVKISLSAPKTSLVKGERTTLHVAVSGLEGIRQPIPLQLVNTSPDTVQLAGGQTQVLTVAPGNVGPDRTYATDRELTGVRAGKFTISAAIAEQSRALVDGAPPGGTTTSRTTVPVAQSQPPATQPTATPHAARNPITSDWPQLSAEDTKSVKDLMGTSKADALAQLVKVMKKYCCNFDTMSGGAPTYDPNVSGEGETDRAKGGDVRIGPDAFSSVAWLYSSLKHEMVHSQQWQDPTAAAAAGSSGREKQAYQREVDQAGNTGLSDAEKAEDKARLGRY
jgi:hypothetical protein